MKRNQRRIDIYKARKRKLKIISTILTIINILVLFSLPILGIIKIKATNIQIILFLIFWLVSIAIMDINEKVNE